MIGRFRIKIENDKLYYYSNYQSFGKWITFFYVGYYNIDTKEYMYYDNNIDNHIPYVIGMLEPEHISKTFALSFIEDLLDGKFFK